MATRESGVAAPELSKSYNMPGWRVGSMVGNPVLVAALAKLKSWFDYGTFTPIQVASILALGRPPGLRPRNLRELPPPPQRVSGRPEQVRLASPATQGDNVRLGPDPHQFKHLGSLEFSKRLLTEAKVAVSPGIGFGDYGDTHVRFSLIENEERTRKALRGIKQMFAKSQKRSCG